MIAVPNKDNYNTSFAIEYWTDGVKDETAEIFAKLKEHDAKVIALISGGMDIDGGFGGGMGVVVISGVVGVIIVIVISFCVIKR